MSLRNQIVLILAVVAVLYVTADVVLLRKMIAEPFRVLEEGEAKLNVARVKAGLQGVLDDLVVRTRGLAGRADTARFIAGEDDTFEADVLQPGALQNLELNLLCFVAQDGKVRWNRAEESDTRAPVHVREFPSEQILDRHPVTLARHGGDESAGLMTTAQGPLLVASRVVRDASGEPAGVVIAGRFFDGALRETLLRRTNVLGVDIWPVDGDLPPDVAPLLDSITAAADPVIATVSDDRLDVYTTADNILGQPTLLVRSAFERSISRSGGRIFDFALLSTLATALLLLLVLLRLLNRIVIGPLSHLTRHTVEIGRTEDMSVRVSMERSDEIGLLSREFDGLMGKLAKSRELVIRTSRLAGMSEIATGVLHSVGNVLNSVNVSANLAKRKTEQLPVADLAAVKDILYEHRANLGAFVMEDPRGRQFLPFLDELSRSLATQKRDILEELRSLTGGMEHMMELVRSQQRYAGMAGVYEPTDLGAEIDAAVVICGQAYGSSGELRVRREYEALPKVPVDRNRLMEILVNLLQNARQAMDDAGTPTKEIALRIRRDGAEHVRIEVEDNGPGIPAENLTRIFAHGFTTRKDGHGFGLHISANAATEMEATLWAESSGPGQGATFILRLPMRTAVAAVAA
jgi:signal transduction histidine kinase